MDKYQGYESLGSECYSKTNFIGLSDENMVYMYHILFCMFLIYFIVVSKHRKSIPVVLSVVLIGLTLVIILQIYKFQDIVVNAQKCASPDKAPEIWTDGTTKWYENIFLLMAWIFGLIIGLHTFLPGTTTHFKLNVSSKVLDSQLFKYIFIVPLSGFIYEFYDIVIKKGKVIKPVPQRLYLFERPLAAYLSMSFVPYLIISMMGSKILENNLGNRIITNRLVSGIFLVAVLYFITWRLNGGLIMSKEKYLELKKSLDNIID